MNITNITINNGPDLKAMRKLQREAEARARRRSRNKAIFAASAALTYKAMGGTIAVPVQEVGKKRR